MECHTRQVPNPRPRHAVTETPDISEALRVAARRWPKDRDHPSRLLRHLIHEGLNSIEPASRARRSDRLTALARVSGSYTGLYEPEYSDELSAEWPE